MSPSLVTLTAERFFAARVFAWAADAIELALIALFLFGVACVAIVAGA